MENNELIQFVEIFGNKKLFCQFIYRGNKKLPSPLEVLVPSEKINEVDFRKTLQNKNAAGYDIYFCPAELSGLKYRIIGRFVSVLLHYIELNAMVLRMGVGLQSICERE